MVLPLTATAWPNWSPRTHISINVSRFPARETPRAYQRTDSRVRRDDALDQLAPPLVRVVAVHMHATGGPQAGRNLAMER
eukprot:7536706-Prorocentrum_lima.AAC.1